MSKLTNDKAEKLAEEYGYDNPFDLLSSYANESILPGICMNKYCDYTVEVEPDCNNGFCPKCKTKSVQSIMVLFDII
ncbi:MAG: hypothetical protein ACTSXT_13625 [Candidatus Helarchaeota archaeon]